MEIPLDGACIRSWKRSDQSSLVRYADNRRIWINLRDRFPHPYKPADARAWLAYATAQQQETNFAIDVGGEAVGGIGFHPQEDVHRRSAELGYWLGEPFWGRGIATQAVRAISAHALRSYDLTRLYAYVFEWNAASARVLAKAGFSLEGRLRRSVTKDGRLIDQFLYAMVAGPEHSP
jgi:RimJ/RimL family protein N-acetyltransferase